MCTTESTFAWVGAIVVNAAFISFIAWGATTIWWIGFSISIVYTLLLFVLARFIDTKSGWDDNGDNDEESGSLHDETDFRMTHDVSIEQDTTPPSSARRMPILANLLYGLFALALGVTGYFLPVNIFYCPGDRPHPIRPPGHWETDITALPDDVQSWASSTEPRESYASFIYIPGPKVTLFRGSSDGSNAFGLWAAPASVYPFQSAEPKTFEGITDPHDFLVTGTGKACFAAHKAMPPPDNPKPYPTPRSASDIIGCCDGKTLETSNTTHQRPYDLLIANTTNILWFKDEPAYRGPKAGTGTLIYSLDPSSMEETLHSTYHPPRGYTPPADDDDDNGDDEDCWASRHKIERQRAFMALFVSALPIAIVSILLWVKRKASSMAITTYIGVSAIATFLFIVINYGQDNMDTFSKWWYSVSGAVWVILMMDLSFSGRRISKAPLVWGINFGSLAFFIGMITLTGIFDQDAVWRWLVFNLFAVVPIGIVGLATRQVFLLVLCAIGWIIDSFHIASLLSQDASPEAEAPIHFVVLGTAGLAIAGAGWLLSKHQESCHQVLAEYMEMISVSRRLFPESEHVALQTEDPLSEPIATSRHDGDEEEAC